MKRIAFLRGIACSMACIGLMLPQSVLAAGAGVNQTTSTPRVTDVALHADGSFNGQVMDAQGVALPGVPVAVWKDGQLLQATTSDLTGHFAFRGLRGGTYLLNSGNGVTTCRVWAPNTAPPIAQDQALIVASGQVLRGNCGDGSCGCNGCKSCCGSKCGLAHFLSNPWVIGAIVATAIAVPVAVHNANKDDDDPQSPNGGN